MDLKQHIRHVPDYPKAGILFYDITTLLRHPEGLGVTIDRLAEPYAKASIDVVVGIESRGFILGECRCQVTRLRVRADSQTGEAAGKAPHGNLRPGIRH